KYLPNHPSVIVKDVPGGNTQIGSLEVINAKPDGYTLGFFNLPGLALGPLIGQGNYDLTKVAWVGQVWVNPYVAAASAKSGITDITSLKNHANLRIGTTGITSTAGLNAFIVEKTLGLKATTIPSGGAAQSVLAASQGAVDFVQFPYGGTMTQEIQAGMLKPLWVTSHERLPQLPQVPTIAELGYPQLESVAQLANDLGTTPGTPADHLAILRDALQKAAQDPEFIQKMQASQYTVAYKNGDDTLQSVKDDISVLTQYAPAIRAKISQGNG
ncbi:MAG: tripartite tricarboxylate transporter substrate binding protein, partial [Alicyclobacillus sp.]|nr:tripartite tricarboxylate transporter substrate binding protein [Alicyclobacillus sp.]